MLLDNDVVADGETKSGALSCRLGREERVEDLFLHIIWNANAVVADPDFHTIAKIFGRGRKDRLVVAICCRAALLKGGARGPFTAIHVRFSINNSRPEAFDHHQRCSVSTIATMVAMIAAACETIDSVFNSVLRRCFVFFLF